MNEISDKTKQVKCYANDFNRIIKSEDKLPQTGTIDIKFDKRIFYKQLQRGLKWDISLVKMLTIYGWLKSIHLIMYL